MEDENNNAQGRPEAAKTVAQAAKELRQDFESLGYFRSDNYARVFGDPRSSFEVKTSEQTCAAYLPGKRSIKL